MLSLIIFYYDNHSVWLNKNGTIFYPSWFMVLCPHSWNLTTAEIARALKHLASLDLIALRTADLERFDWEPSVDCDIRLKTGNIQRWLQRDTGWKLPLRRAAQERPEAQTL